MRVPQVSDRLKEIPAQALRGVFAGIGQLLLITDKLRNKTPAGTGMPRARTLEPAETAPKETVPEETVTVTDAAAESVAAAREEAEPVTTETPKDSKASKTPAIPQGSATAETASAPRVPKARDFDKTGNVRLLGGADVAARSAGKTAKAGKAAQASAPADASPAKDASPATDASAATDASLVAEASPATEVGPVADAGPVAEAADGAGDSGPPLPNFDELSVPSLRARLRNLDIAQVRQMLEYEQTHVARPEVITMFERRIAKLEAEA
jgi:hypothetical protein